MLRTINCLDTILPTNPVQSSPFYSSSSAGNAFDRSRFFFPPDPADTRVAITDSMTKPTNTGIDLKRFIVQ